MARKECVRFGQRAKFLGKKNAFRRALDNSKRASLAKSNRRIAAKVSRARKTEGRLVFGPDVRSVSPVALPTGRIFVRSKSGIRRLSFKQFAAGGASVDVSRTAARRAAARHARKT